MRISRRVLRIVIGGIALAGVSSAAYAFFRVPGVGPFVCPTCFGFEQYQGRVYVEQSAAPDQHKDVADSILIARSAVKDFFGSITGDPVIFACVTETCYRRADGGRGATRGFSIFDRAVIVSPRRMGSVILTHELTHSEFHHRLGTRMAAIPAWFDEGLAAYVSNDPRYIALPDVANRCVVNPTSATLPSSARDWGRRAGRDDNDQLYATAACRVSIWLKKHGGRSAVLDLIARVNAGASFDSSFSG